MYKSQWSCFLSFKFSFSRCDEWMPRPPCILLNRKVNPRQYVRSAAWEDVLIGYNHSDMYLFVTVGRASPLPQAAHIRVSWVQGEAQADQEAQKQQDDGALQSRHGPEGTKDRHSLRDVRTQTFQRRRHRAQTYSYCYEEGGNTGGGHTKSNIIMMQNSLVLQEKHERLMLCLGCAEEVVFLFISPD